MSIDLRQCEKHRLTTAAVEPLIIVMDVGWAAVEPLIIVMDVGWAAVEPLIIVMDVGWRSG